MTVWTIPGGSLSAKDYSRSLPVEIAKSFVLKGLFLVMGF